MQLDSRPSLPQSLAAHTQLLLQMVVPPVLLRELMLHSVNPMVLVE